MLQDCKDVLQDFADKLKKYAPRNSKKMGNAFNALKWILQEESRANIMRRLERHTNTLELALLGLSLYATPTIYISLMVREVANQEAEATVSEREAALHERGAQEKERLAAEEERAAQTVERYDAKKRANDARLRDTCNYLSHTCVNFLVLQRKQILHWLYQRSFTEMHQSLQTKRVSETGGWFLSNNVFRNWMSKSDFQVLCCVGIGSSFAQGFLICLCSWCR
jgi:hypothetical protein